MTSQRDVVPLRTSATTARRLEGLFCRITSSSDDSDVSRVESVQLSNKDGARKKRERNAPFDEFELPAKLKQRDDVTDENK